jgi:8-oxo-dGTP diphosphatase
MEMTMMKYVTGFLFSEDYQSVVLISKLSPSWQAGLLNGVGGKIEQGESEKQAMSREFMEETGVSIDQDQWINFAVIERPSQYSVHFFSAKSHLFSSVKSIEKEKVDIFLVTKLPDNIIHNLRWLIPLASDPELQLNTPVTIYERTGER